MSEPRHIFTFGDGSYFVQIQRTHDDTDGLLRYSLTSGPEFEALMERARTTLPSGGAHTFSDVMKLLMDRGDILRDLLTYLGEQP